MSVYICARTCCREMIIGGTNLSDLMPALNSGYPTEFCMHRGAQRQYLCICTSKASKVCLPWTQGTPQSSVCTDVRSVSIVRICAFVLLVFCMHRGAQRQNLCICTSCISGWTSRFFACFTCFTGTKAQKLTLGTSSMYCSGGFLHIYIYICMQRMLTYADVCWRMRTSSMYCSGGFLSFQVKKKRPSIFLRA